MAKNTHQIHIKKRSLYFLNIEEIMLKRRESGENFLNFINRTKDEQKKFANRERSVRNFSLTQEEAKRKQPPKELF